MDRLYCTVADLVTDLFPMTGGDEAALLKHIQAASQFIDQRMGEFIPFTEAKRFDGNGGTRLRVPPLLAVTGIVNDDDTLVAADYILYAGDNPGRMWENGPYTAIVVATEAANLSAWYADLGAVVVTGRWGKYEKSVDTGATVQNNPQAIADTSLAVADGSKISPGMVLLIGTEQELATATGDPTASVTTLGAALDNASEALTPAAVAAGSIGEIVRVGFEKMKIVDKNATQWSVLRGYENTKKAVHSSAAAVDVYRTFIVSRGVNGTTAAAHIKDVVIYRYIPPYDINLLAKTIAALVKKLADSQYAGRTGNAELGQIFYNDAFPRDELEKIEANYEVGA